MGTRESAPTSTSSAGAGHGRLRSLGLLGGVVYTLLGLSAGYFVGLYLADGARGPAWVTIMAVASVGVSLAVGAWMTLTALRGPSAASARTLRHLTAAAMGLMLGAPFDYFEIGGGFLAYLVFAVAFGGAELGISRWIAAPAAEPVADGEREPVAGPPEPTDSRPDA